MEIELATLDHAEYISEKLSKYFEDVNNHFGSEKYKTELDLMQRNVSKRLEDQESEFKYYVAIENGEIVGFANILLSQENPEILVVIGDSKEVKETLFENMISIFKEIKCDFVYGEMNDWDEAKDLLAKYNAESIQIKYKINL